MSLLPALTWMEPGGLPECPYFYRSILDFWGMFSLRLHWWIGSDDNQAFHDHPYWFYTLVLWGGYDDIDSEYRIDHLRIGSFRFRPAEWRHTVQLNTKPTITLLLVGPPNRRWSFYIGNKAVKRDKFFVEHGHHPCDPTQSRVRIRPDGTRILEEIS